MYNEKSATGGAKVRDLIATTDAIHICIRYKFSVMTASFFFFLISNAEILRFYCVCTPEMFNYYKSPGG